MAKAGLNFVGHQHEFLAVAIEYRAHVAALEFRVHVLLLELISGEGRLHVLASHLAGERHQGTYVFAVLFLDVFIQDQFVLDRSRARAGDQHGMADDHVTGTDVDHKFVFGGSFQFGLDVVCSHTLIGEGDACFATARATVLHDAGKHRRLQLQAAWESERKHQEYCRV